MHEKSSGKQIKPATKLLCSTVTHIKVGRIVAFQAALFKVDAYLQKKKMNLYFGGFMNNFRYQNMNGTMLSQIVLFMFLAHHC